MTMIKAAYIISIDPYVDVMVIVGEVYTDYEGYDNPQEKLFCIVSL